MLSMCKFFYRIAFSFLSIITCWTMGTVQVTWISYSGFELGSCASDLIWRKALREMDSSITPDYAHDDDEEPNDPGMKATRIQEKVKNVVKNWIFAMPNLDFTSRGYNVTPKLVKLVQILKACEPQDDLFRGIVFGNATFDRPNAFSSLLTAFYINTF